MLLADVLTGSQIMGFLAIRFNWLSRCQVAPHVGAWIETTRFYAYPFNLKSRASRRRVD